MDGLRVQAKLLEKSDEGKKLGSCAHLDARERAVISVGQHFWPVGSEGIPDMAGQREHRCLMQAVWRGFGAYSEHRHVRHICKSLCQLCKRSENGTRPVMVTGGPTKIETENGNDSQVTRVQLTNYGSGSLGQLGRHCCQKSHFKLFVERGFLLDRLGADCRI